MKITFLGTSHGVPSSTRYCQSILIEAGNGAYLVDAGAPVMDLLLRRSFDLSTLRACFITHMHGDHVHGLLPLADLASWYFKEMDFDVFLPDQAGIDAVEDMLRISQDGEIADLDRVRFRLMKEGPVYEDENIRVRAFPTAHLAAKNRPAYGYELLGDGKKLYISGDLACNDCLDYPEFVNTEEYDAFVVECAHFDVKTLTEKLKGCRAKCVMPVHIFPSEKYELLEEFARTAPFRMYCPKDGDILEI